MTAPTTTDLVKWLREQIADDERVAKAARGHTTGQWEPDGNLVRARATYHDISVVKWSWPQEIAHIVQHDPAAVLAQCEAHTLVLAFARGLLLMGESDEVDASVPPASARVAELLLKGLAVAYQHRPGYRAEWRP